MSTDLVNIETNNLATNDAWGDEQEEVRPQYIQIKQPLSQGLDEFKNGLFVQKTVGTSWEKMEIVPLQIRLTRKKQTPYREGEKSEMICRSNNRIVPVKNDDRFEPVATSCAVCPYGDKAWDGYDRKTGEGTKPSCEKQAEILFIDNETKLPFIFTARGGSAKAVEAVFEALKARSKFLQAEDAKKRGISPNQGRRPQPYEFMLSITTEKSGKNWVLKVTQVAQLSKEKAAEFGPLFEQFVSSRNASHDHEAIEDAITDGVPEPTEAVVAPREQTKPEYLPPASRKAAGPRPAYTPLTTVTSDDEDEYVEI